MPENIDNKAADVEVAAAPRRMSTRRLVILALFTALAVILSFIEIPVAFIAPFLKYDASFVPSILAAMVYGPGAGCLVGIIAAGIHLLVYGNVWGGVMNMIAVIAFCIPTGLIFKKAAAKAREAGNVRGNTVRLIVAMVVGAVFSIVLALVADIFVIPIYMGVTTDVVIDMLPLLGLFNLFKEAINVVLSVLIYRALGKYLLD